MPRPDSPRSAQGAAPARPDPRFLSLPRAVKELQMSRRRVIDLIHGGRLKARLIDGYWWIETKSLQHFASWWRRQ
jgi:hypothetical protein